MCDGSDAHQQIIEFEELDIRLQFHGNADEVAVPIMSPAPHLKRLKTGPPFRMSTSSSRIVTTTGKIVASYW